MTGIWWPLWGRGARSGSHIAYGRASATTDASLKSAPTIDERPRWIWVIFVFYALSTAWVLLSLLLVCSGRPRAGIDADQARRAMQQGGSLRRATAILVSARRQSVGA